MMNKKNLFLAVLFLLFFSVGSLQAQVITKSNSLEIISSPSPPFNNVALRFTSGSTTNYDFTLFGQEDFAISETNVAPRLYIQKGGNIGIGTINPTSKLTLNGDLEFNDGSGNFFQGDIINVDEIKGADDLRFNADGQGIEDMLIGGNGDVGIGLGIITATEKLDVNGNIQIRGDRLTFFTDGIDTKNLFIGDVAGDNITTGCCSTVLGIAAGGALTDANSNTLIGNGAGRVLTGPVNTFLGQQAGGATTSGFGNVFIGNNAGLTNISGNTNLVVGYLADPTTGALNNSASIGAFAASNASDKMQLGSSTTTLATTGGYTIVSDGRFKKDLRNDIQGLDFVMNLKPVSYSFDYQQYESFLRDENGLAKLPETYIQQLQEKSQLREVGFIAQEVAETSDAIGIPFNGVYRPQNEQDNYALDYGRLTVPLVKATQEQQEIIEEQSAKIESLENKNLVLENRLADLEALVEQLVNNQPQEEAPVILNQSPSLEQNEPNPFNGSTVVRYFIPEVVQQAELRVTDTAGKLIKTVTIQARGEGQTTFDAMTLSSGNYQYSLFVDGQLIGTRKMLLFRN